ncbi:MAG: nuclear transport factor 2 family protein [Sterolibacterium sp.]|jgi:ketosteroid isomerase-like protein|nr:nuclear transport factor 2 family protein [Sterolibacterium sp.]
MPLQKPIYTTPQDTENAFYEAIRRADLDAFMNVWAEDEEIICILPNGPRFSGYSNIREAWRRIFNSGRRFSMEVSNRLVMPSMLVTVHNVLETICMLDAPQEPGQGGGQSTPILATNIYIRSATGWRLQAHHASLTSSGNDTETTQTLH